METYKCVRCNIIYPKQAYFPNIVCLNCLDENDLKTLPEYNGVKISTYPNDYDWS